MRDRRKSPLTFLLVLALVLDVFGHGFTIVAFAYRSNVVTVGPKLTAPELLLQARKHLEQLARRNTFEDPNDVADPVFRMSRA